MLNLFVICLLSNENLQILSSQRKPDVPEKDNATITALIERIKINKTNCYSQLQNKLDENCKDLSEKRRISLAIQIMLCERENDERLDSLPIYQNDDQFTEELQESDLHIFTTYYLNVDIICYNAASMSQSHSHQKKVSDLYTALQTSARYISLFRRKYYEENQKIKERLQGISKGLTNGTNTIQEVMDIVNFGQKNISQLETSIRSISTFYHSKIRILQIIGASFLISYILPDLFAPIFFVSFLKIFLDDKIKITNELANKISDALYYSACSVILIACFIKRTNEIKRRIFGTHKIH